MRQAMLSLTTIGVAILVLITVAVVAMILNGTLSGFSDDVDNIKAAYGPPRYCDDLPADEDDPAATSAGGVALNPSLCVPAKDNLGANFRDVPSGKVCCVRS